MKLINISKDVFPLGVFKSKASRILKQLKDSQRPVVITLNGSPAAVLITPESYDEMLNEQAFIDSVKQGLEDNKGGNSISDENLTEAQEWKDEHKAAIKAYNEFVDEHGCFGDDFRAF